MVSQSLSIYSRLPLLAFLDNRVCVLFGGVFIYISLAFVVVASSVTVQCMRDQVQQEEEGAFGTGQG